MLIIKKPVKAALFGASEASTIDLISSIDSLNIL
jgi:hypothetical protein